MSELTTAAVDAARLYKEIKQETISEIMSDIKPSMNNIHFGGFVFYADNRNAMVSKSINLKATYELKMKLNGNEKTLKGVVEYNYDTMPEQIGGEIFRHVLETIKNNIYDSCIPIIQRQLNIQDIK